jgi:hypothetical protein
MALMDMPKFSIIIPTRNRGYCLGSALHSALNQVGGHTYEVIVSDNCSDDNTRDVVAAFNSERLRYIKSPRPLSMPDSWEFAVGNASGQWVTVLADDDVLSSRALTIIDSATRLNQSEVISWRCATYYFPGSAAPRTNSLLYYAFTQSSTINDSREGLKGLFRFAAEPKLPKMLNSVATKEALARIRGRLGRIFLPPAPDYTSCVAMLWSVPRYLHIDTPLTTSGNGSQNPPSSPEAYDVFIREFGKGLRYSFAPIPELGIFNDVPESILSVKSALSPDLQGIDLNEFEYARMVCRYIEKAHDKGFKVEQARKGLNVYLSSWPKRERLRLVRTTRLDSIRDVISSNVKRALFRVQLLTMLASKCSDRKLVTGAGAGFRDILGAQQFLDRLINKPAP